MLFTSYVPKFQWVLAGLATLTLVMTGACNKDEEQKPSASKEMVVVTKEGTKLDPAVPKARIPDGAWMCDMGTVHFAKSEKGEGSCDLCGMPLTQKGAPAEPAATKAPVPVEPAAKDPAAVPKELADVVDPAEARRSLKKMSETARTYYADPDDSGKGAKQ